MRSKKIILDKCPMYMSLAAIHLSSHGDPGKIYLTEKEKDFLNQIKLQKQVLIN